MNNLKLRLLYGLSLQDQILFAKRLSMLTKAGVTLLEGLQMMTRQANRRASRRVYGFLSHDLESGMYLHKSMQKLKHVFGDFSINLVRVGELSGSLPENLEYLAVELKKKQELRRKVIGSLIYPVIIVLATLGISAMLILYVFPKILPIFKSLNFDLPWTTRALIWVSDLFLQHGLIIGLGFTGFIVLFFVGLMFKPFRHTIHHIILKLPIFGRLSQTYQMANFCRTMGLLLRCDVMIVDATIIIAEITSNLVYKKHYYLISENLRSGQPISSHLQKKDRLFPPIMSQMVHVGETAGNLAETLAYLGDMYEAEVDDTTKNLSTVIEPVLMVFMGLLVGFIAISVITPIYEVTQHIHP